MDRLEQIEGEEGLYIIRKVKIMYEYISMECDSIIKRNLNKRKIEIVRRKK